jgi:hypothetical protein
MKMTHPKKREDARENKVQDTCKSCCAKEYGTDKKSHNSDGTCKCSNELQEISRNEKGNFNDRNNKHLR